MTEDMADATVPIAQRHEVRARFANSEALDAAATQLTMAGFDRADLALPEMDSGAIPSLESPPVDTEADARQGRTLHTSLAAAAGAMVGGGIAVATGGAALAAAAAAIAVGGGAGALAGAISTVVNNATQSDRDDKAAAGELVLAVRTPTPEKRDLAERIARDAGAQEIIAS